MANEIPTGWRGASIGFLVLCLGAFIIGVGLGVVPVPPESVHAPGWVIACAGLAFFAAGLAVVQQALQLTWLKYAPGLVILLSLTAVLNWVAFGPGERNGEGGLTVVGIEVPVSSDLVGRLGFGAGAVVLDLLLIAGVVRAFRGTRSKAPRPASRAGLPAKQRTRPGPGRARSSSV